MNRTRLLLFLFFTFILAGCTPNEPATPTRQAVVIDLDAVARALGEDALISRKVEKNRETLEAELKKIAKSLQDEIDKKKTEVAGLKDKKERKKAEQALQQLTLESARKLKQSRQLAEQKAAQYRLQQFQAFREKVKQAVGPVARKHHALMVKLVTADTLWHDPAIDITGEVIDALRAQPGPDQAADTATGDTTVKTNP